MHFPSFFSRSRSSSNRSAGGGPPVSPPAQSPAAVASQASGTAGRRNAPIPPGTRVNRFGEPMPMLGAESPIGITSPKSLAEAARPRSFSGLSDTPPQPLPTSPRAPLESVHAPGGTLAGQAATTLPEAKSAARLGLTGAGFSAGGLNGAAMIGMIPAMPPVEPISIALTAVASASDAAAAIGAHRRGEKLRTVQENIPNFRCDHPGAEHDRLAKETLPYAIGQQEKRRNRKGRSAIPVLGSMGEGIRGVWTHFSKKRKGTLGVDREAHSNALARHLVPHHCELAEEMGDALFGRQRMEALRGMDPDDAAKAIAARLKTN